MKYNNHLNYRDRRRLLIKLRIVYAFLFIVFLLTAGVVYLKYLKPINIVNKNVSSQTNSVVANPISTFRSEFFQFQATNTWAEVPKESSKNKYVYRSYNGGILEHELDIFVNEIPSQNDLKINRVLPVSLIEVDDGTTKLDAGEVSESCEKALKKDLIPPDVQNVTYNGVSFLCYGKINQYNVIIGEVGNNANMNMKRPDGTSAVYTIYYKDLRAINGPAEIDQIVKSFQSI